MWSFGTINGYEYQVKTYDEGSDEFGIEGGKISKLFVMKDGKMVISYDREWGKKPTTKEAKQILADILQTV